MANITASLSELMTLGGAVVAGVVDAESGMLLGSVGAGVNMELAAAGNTEVVRAKLATMNSLNLNDEITDILITLGKQYHIVRPMPGRATVFIYLVLDRAKANLALARLKAESVATALTLR